jgi:hypothetical protein
MRSESEKENEKKGKKLGGRNRETPGESWGV